jgi:hypothetical protein
MSNLPVVEEAERYDGGRPLQILVCGWVVLPLTDPCLVISHSSFTSQISCLPSPRESCCDTYPPTWSNSSGMTKHPSFQVLCVWLFTVCPFLLQDYKLHVPRDPFFFPFHYNAWHIEDAQQIFIDWLSECSLEKGSPIGHGGRSGENVSRQENSIWTGPSKSKRKVRQGVILGWFIVAGMVWGGGEMARTRSSGACVQYGEVEPFP